VLSTGQRCGDGLLSNLSQDDYSIWHGRGTGLEYIGPTLATPYYRMVTRFLGLLPKACCWISSTAAKCTTDEEAYMNGLNMDHLLNVEVHAGYPTHPYTHGQPGCLVHGKQHADPKQFQTSSPHRTSDQGLRQQGSTEVGIHRHQAPHCSHYDQATADSETQQDQFCKSLTAGPRKLKTEDQKPLSMSKDTHQGCAHVSRSYVFKECCNTGLRW